MRRITSSTPDRSSKSPRRRGIATVWIIASVPAIFTLLIVVTDIGTVWQARMELETATEAAALAAVKEWKATGDTNLARTAAQEFAAANTVLGYPVILASNAGGGGTNDNSLCDGDILLGNLTSAGVFESGVTPSSTNYYGARVIHAQTVPSLWKTFGGFTFGPYTIHAESVARLQFNPGGTPQLTRPDSFVCP